MSVSKKPGRGSDQFPLRLPDGLRDRIKAYADSHGRSMNAEIVRVLEREYPQPLSISERLDEISDHLEVLQAGATNASVDKLVEQIKGTITDIVSGRIDGLSAEERVRIEQAKIDLEIDLFKYPAPDEHDLDPEERQMFDRTGTTAKIVKLDR